MQTHGHVKPCVEVRCHNIDLHAQYYEYESYAPYGTNGSHQLSRATTKVMKPCKCWIFQMYLACCPDSVSSPEQMLMLTFTLSWCCCCYWHTEFWVLPCWTMWSCSLARCLTSVLHVASCHCWPGSRNMMYCYAGQVCIFVCVQR